MPASESPASRAVLSGPAQQDQPRQIRAAWHMAPKPEPALGVEPHCVGFVERSPWWGGDLQTIRNHLMWRGQPLESHASVLEFPTSDGSGDRLTGTLERPINPTKSPLIMLIHGLTGCEDSFYVRGSARFHLARGRSVLRLNLRGAGTSRRVAGGYYHAGCASDLEDVIGALGCEATRYGVFAVGYSLGGNILLNLLSRLRPPHRLVGAATVSAPIEPLEACERIMAPRNLVYHALLLRRMKRDVLSPQAHLTARERRLVQDATSVFEFDDKFVAPRHGFGTARIIMSGPPAPVRSEPSPCRRSCCMRATTRGSRPRRIAPCRAKVCPMWRSS